MLSPHTVKTAQPQRISGASVAVITRTHNGHTEWLLQWNPKWQAMNLIGGRKEATDANDLTCMIREIHEELFEELSVETLTRLQTALNGENDTYTRAHSAWQDAYIETITRIGGAPCECDDVSLSAKCLTHYIFHIYQVKLQADVSFFQDDSIPTEWASAGDITRGLTVQGRSIGSTVMQILMWVRAQERSL